MKQSPDRRADHLTTGRLIGRCLLLLVAISLVACGSAAGTPTSRPPGSAGGSPTTPASPPASGSPVAPATPTGEISHPSGASELVLRIDRTGGLVPREALLTALPFVSLYGDGSLITQGPQIAIYPPPALPNLLRSRINEQGIQLILREARAAGLLAGDKQYDVAGVADAQTTVFTVNASGRTSVVSAYALGIDTPGAKLPPDQVEARQKLLAFQQRLFDALSWLPANTVETRDEPFPIERLQLVSTPAETVQGTPTPSTKDWPLATPLAQLGQPYDRPSPEARCAVLQGAELERLLPELRGSNWLTHWRSGGAEYQLYPRPLLPDEAGCPAG